MYCTIREEYRDDAENFLMLDITINGKSYGIGAVYGPNNTSSEFFDVLKHALNHMKNKGISDFIIGGDWNATVDRRPVIHNIDTFHMSGLPNPKNSELLEDLCREFSLLDPYRVLYPYKRDYTYSPFGTVRLNRSCIDFYLISATMIDSINDCVIAESMACKLFDHKQVSLYLNNPRIRKIKTDRLSNSYLSENLLRFSVEIATHRAHIYSLLCNGFYPLNAQIKETEVNKINLVLSTYKELVRSMEKAAAEGRDERMDLIIAGQEQQIKLQFDDMLPIITLERLAKSCNPAEFFVALTAEIRKSGSRTQKFLGKLKNIEENVMLKRLSLLKENYETNYHAIFELENTLKIRKDNALRDRLKDIKIFECLNAEKATPLLLGLAKKSNSTDSLTNIKQNNGDAFLTDKDRENFIVQFYSDLYKSDTDVQGNIEEFLGPEICNNPTVLASKLTQLECQDLDRPLEIEEQDRAIRDANLRSAPGIDGYS
jgi:hypothetical protein